MMFEVIYYDNHLLVVNKPNNLLTQPNGLGGESVEEMAKRWIKEKEHKPGRVFCSALHRLDRSASGLVLLAKTSKALSRLSLHMREGLMRKTYYARVAGIPLQQGRLEHFLTHESFRSRVSHDKDPQAKKAILEFERIAIQGAMSLLKIDLKTGRYHQIRCQLAHIGHPIVGDRKYGSELASQREGIELHHAKLEFVHPVTKENIVLETPPPF